MTHHDLGGTMKSSLRRSVGVGVALIAFASLGGVSAARGLEGSASTNLVRSCASVNFDDGAYAVAIRAVAVGCRKARIVAANARSGREGAYRAYGYTCVSAGLRPDTALTICVRGVRRVSWENVA